MPIFAAFRGPAPRWVLLIPMALALPAIAFPAANGAISGIVKAQDGTPVVGALVLYGPLAPAHPHAAPAMSAPAMSVTTSSTGGFSISNLAAATYLVCVQAHGYLDPCHWSSAPPTFTVAAAQVVSNATVKVSQSYQLPIRVSDPQNVLANEG